MNRPTRSRQRRVKATSNYSALPSRAVKTAPSARWPEPQPEPQPQPGPASQHEEPELTSRTVSLSLLGGVAVAGVLLMLFVWVLSSGKQFAPAPTNASGQVPPVSTLKSSDYHSLLVSPTDPQHLWFGSHSGIEESNDGGRTWRPLAGFSGDAMSMAISAPGSSSLYVAGHNLFKRSTDEGRTWQDVQTDLPGTDLHGFAADAGNSQHLYTLLAGQGVFESVDGGGKWKPLTAQPPGASGPLAVVPGTPPTLFATTGLGVMRSKDGGQSWHPAGSGLPQGQADVQALTAVRVAPGEPEELYAGTADGLYHSKDGGTTWQQTALSGQELVALAVSQSTPLRLYLLAAGGAVYSLEGPALGHSN